MDLSTRCSRHRGRRARVLPFIHAPRMPSIATSNPAAASFRSVGGHPNDRAVHHSDGAQGPSTSPPSAGARVDTGMPRTRDSGTRGGMGSASRLVPGTRPRRASRSNGTNDTRERCDLHAPQHPAGVSRCRTGCGGICPRPLRGRGETDHRSAERQGPHGRPSARSRRLWRRCGREPFLDSRTEGMATRPASEGRRRWGKQVSNDQRPASGMRRGRRRRRSRQGPSRLMQLTILGGSVLLAGSIGHTMGHGELREARSSFRAELADAQAQRSSTRAELEGARAAHVTKERSSRRRLEVLEARRQLALSLGALDLRDFGTANARLSEASGLLDGALHDGAIRALSSDLVSADLEVSRDLRDARAMIQQFAARLDDSVEGSPRSPSVTSASAERAARERRDDSFVPVELTARHPSVRPAR